MTVDDEAETPALPPLPETARLLAAELLSGRLLGASRGIRTINDLLCAIAEGWRSSAEELVETLLRTATFFVATRGLNTPAIGNALNPLIRQLETWRSASDPDTIREWIETHRNVYNAGSLRNTKRMAEVGASVLADAAAVLAFDYSSTMLAILERLGGCGRAIRVIVPESRCLDGGRAIAEEATVMGHSAVFVPDMSVGHFIGESDAVLIGAETIFANGDCWNTIGSYPLAELARIHHVPFYVATELIKLDTRSFDGIRPSVRPREFGALLGYPETFSHPERISVVAPELDTTPGSLITGYITPVGLLLPAHIREEARKAFASALGAEGDGA
jgi:ribose 1,5-bisphosphate isomerase